MEKSRVKLEKSLEIVGEYFGDVKDACVKGYYQIDTERLSGMKETVRCIKMYVILKDIKKLAGRKLDVLAYYLLFGYNKKTKSIILDKQKITDSNLNNINCELRKLGVINRSGHNQSSNEVNKDLLQFKDFIVDKKGSYILISVEE